MKVYLGELQKIHVGHGRIRLKGIHVNVYDAIGFVQETDIGKRVYCENGIISVENNEQRDKRIVKTKTI